MNENHKHLTPDAIDSLLEAQGLGLNARDSVAESRLELGDFGRCDYCQERVRAAAAANQALRNLALTAEPIPGEKCPDSDELWAFVVGDLDVRRIDLLAAHLNRCDGCSATVRRLAEVFVSDPSPEESAMVAGLNSSTKAWHERLAREIAASQSEQTTRRRTNQQEIRPRRVRLIAVFAGVAAIIAILAICAATYVSLRKPSVEKLLAAAYAEQRPFEPRLSIAGYAPFQANRGTAETGSAASTSLIDANSRLAHEFGSHANEAPWVAAKGRAALLGGAYDEAIRNLQAALVLDPNSVPVRTDLATAYTQRAVTKSQPWDNGEAAEILSGILKDHPTDLVATFNLALVLERENLFNEAALRWGTYLELDPSSPWAKEAQQHLNEDRQKIHEIGEERRILDPSGFADLSFRSAIAADIERRPEDYLDAAIVSWLPAAFPIDGIKSMSAQRYAGAAVLLARNLSGEHRDRWLVDLLDHESSPPFNSAIAKLSQAVRADQEGDYATAAKAAEISANRFEQSLSVAGYSRARLEQIYALRLAHDAAGCSPLSRKLVDQIGSTGYGWILVQATLELQECLNMTGKVGYARAMSDAGLTVARSCHYPILYLRALVFAADMDASVGDSRQAWSRVHDGLALAWREPRSPMRIYSLETELDLLADQSGQKRFDEIILSEALNTIGSDRDLLMRAMLNDKLAQVALSAGDPSTAKTHFRKAEDLFSAAPRSSATDRLKTEAEIGFARSELARGNIAGSLDELQRIPHELSGVSDRFVLIDYFQTFGEAELAVNQFDEAEKNLCSAARIVEFSLKHLDSDADRVAWDHVAANTYRTLVRSRIHRKDFVGALELWEWYRGASVRHFFSANRKLAETRANSGGCQLHDPSEVRRLLSSLTRETVISYAMFDDGIAEWNFDDRGIRFKWITAEKNQIDPLVKRLSSLCATPSSSQREILLVGSELYHRLIAPFEGELLAGRRLVLEPDGFLSRIPFPALRRPDGRYLTEFAEITESPGIYYGEIHRPGEARLVSEPVLAVAEESEGRYQGAVLSRLPGAAAEVAALSSRFPKTVVLTSSEATIQNISKLIRVAAIFHFAGHGIALPSGTALVLSSEAGREGSSTTLDVSSVSSMILPRLQLAVLSACSSGLGTEDNGLLDSGSLARAFMLHGVSDVIASKWNVDSEATRKLMEAFYGSLADGYTSTRALREAMFRVRSEPQTAHPFYWASFSDFGKI